MTTKMRLPKGKKKIKRKKSGKSLKYFTEDTQNSILKYQDHVFLLTKHCNFITGTILGNVSEYAMESYNIKHREESFDDFCKKFFPDDLNLITIPNSEALVKENRNLANSIYETEIHPAFDKLVENLIFIYNFTSFGDSYEDLKSDCVAFLYDALPKFDRTKGFKAFSYYNMIAKNFLIIKSKQKALKVKRNVSLDDKDSMDNSDLQTVEEHWTSVSPDDQVISSELSIFNKKILKEIKKKTFNDVEIRCIDCIIQFFENPDFLPYYNKRGIFTYIKEMTQLSSKQLAVAMAGLKRKYREVKEMTDEDFEFM